VLGLSSRQSYSQSTATPSVLTDGKVLFFVSGTLLQESGKGAHMVQVGLRFLYTRIFIRTIFSL
jgi:hypothetical protein